MHGTGKLPHACLHNNYFEQGCMIAPNSLKHWQRYMYMYIAPFLLSGLFRTHTHILSWVAYKDRPDSYNIILCKGHLLMEHSCSLFDPNLVCILWKKNKVRIMIIIVQVQCTDVIQCTYMNMSTCTVDKYGTSWYCNCFTVFII